MLKEDTHFGSEEEKSIEITFWFENSKSFKKRVALNQGKI